MTKSRHKLGKGLKTLIDENAVELPDRQTGVNQVAMTEIRVNPNQPRREINREALDELRQSIVENGVLQPVLLARTENGYRLIAGERRYRAAMAAGLTRIPAHVLKDITEEKIQEMALVENIQREDLSPIDYAQGLQQLVDDYDLTQEQVAQKLGKSRSEIANMLRLLKLPSLIRQSLQAGNISVGHAKVLLSLQDKDEQVRFWREVLRRSLSVRQLEERVNRGASRRPAPRREKSPDLVAVEERLREHFATRIEIYQNRQGGGRIEFRYGSVEELNRLLELME
jgi:ParB family transcriptional regulator, chromosome partitioning protein